MLLGLFVKMNVENVNVINTYVMESNIRIRTFEAILSNDSNTLKESLISNNLIQKICSKYLKDVTEFDITYYKHTVKFLPFRKFLPFKNEALGMIQIIIWNKIKCQRLFKDLIIGFGKYNNLVLEQELLQKNHKGYIFLSCLVFFDIIIQSNDEKMTFILKQNQALDLIDGILDQNPSYNRFFHYLDRYFKGGIGVLEV